MLVERWRRGYNTLRLHDKTNLNIGTKSGGRSMKQCIDFLSLSYAWILIRNSMITF